MTHTALIAKTLPILLAMSLSACGGGSGPGTQPDPDPDPDPPPWPPLAPILPVWETPECEVITGPPVAAHSIDGGITIIPNEEDIHFTPHSRTQSVVAIRRHGGLIFAARGMSIYRSTDGGCTWEHMHEAPEPLTLVAQGIPSVGFGIGDRGDTLYVLGSHVLHTFDIPFHAIDIAPTRFSTLHALAADGRIMRLEYDSFEQDRWVDVTVAPPTGAPRFLAVNPGRSPFDPAHLVVSMASGPPMVTLDGGMTWDTAEGILDDADSVIAGRTRFSQILPDTDATVAWIPLVRTYTDPDSGETIEERAIARSTDGGLTFSDVIVDDGDDVIIDDDLIETDRLSTILGTEEEIMFTSGSCPNEEPRLYHYRADDDSLTIITWDTGEIFGIESLYRLGAFFEDGSEVVYFGHRAVDTCD